VDGRIDSRIVTDGEIRLEPPGIVFSVAEIYSQ
jgi:hypothetical protein